MSDVATPAARVFPLLIARARSRLRENVGRRVVGAMAALAIEALLLLVLLSLGETRTPKKIAGLAVSSFDVREEAPKPQKQPEYKAAAAPHSPQPPTEPSPQPSTVAPPPPAATIQLSPQLQTFDLSKLPKAPRAPAHPAQLVGPVDTPHFGDSERVGTAPNGQPMYAARWYTKPTDRELRGYLSTAQPPAWGLITCKTVPDFRVEDCVGLDEYPQGSNMLRAILAAAWQFRVRPPQVGGVSQVGDWVRIRIEYEFKPAGNPYGGAEER
jgi:protein TonB